MINHPIPDTDRVRTAFKQSYYSQHRTYDGWEDEFRWWINPKLVCVQTIKARPEKRCKTPCEFCIGHYNRTIVKENQ